MNAEVLVKKPEVVLYPIAYVHFMSDRAMVSVIVHFSPDHMYGFPPISQVQIAGDEAPGLIDWHLRKYPLSLSWRDTSALKTSILKQMGL